MQKVVYTKGHPLFHLQRLAKEVKRNQMITIKNHEVTNY
jgi:hypothetical protein